MKSVPRVSNLLMVNYQMLSFCRAQPIQLEKHQQTLPEGIFDGQDIAPGSRRIQIGITPTVHNRQMEWCSHPATGVTGWGGILKEEEMCSDAGQQEESKQCRNIVSGEGAFGPELEGGVGFQQAVMGKGHQGRNSMNKWMEKTQGVERKGRKLLGLIMMGRGRLGPGCEGSSDAPCLKDKAEEEQMPMAAWFLATRGITALRVV